MDIAHKRTYTSLKIHAFRHHGYLSLRQLPTLKIPATPEILEEVLLTMQTEGLLTVIQKEEGEIVYDFLPFLEKTIEESVLDLATRLQLAKIYVFRKMWTHAIAELRVTRTNPMFKKESLYLLGRCFEAKDAVEKAKENYEHLLAVDYFYMDVLERITKLTEHHNQQTAIATAITQTTTMITVQQQLHHILQDRYEIVQELGRGAAGIVYHAIDLKLKRDVALKVLYQQAAQDSKRMANFLQEARLAAQLDHPNIVDVYDVNVDSQFIAMEFVDGGTLRDIINKCKGLNVVQARNILLQLCRGLQIAHNAGVLHRDIKPGNIFITKQGKVKLGDFGIAHIANLEQDAFTQISAQIGTLPYMSPEQAQGENLTIASDIYAVGIVFYEMLTSAPPFTRGDIIYHHIYTTPDPPGIAPQIDAIVLHCLEKDPIRRFQSAAELMQSLKDQEKDEKQRLGKYRELLQIALIDKELSEHEFLVLTMKRNALNITDEEARQVERELGVTLPYH